MIGRDRLCSNGAAVASRPAHLSALAFRRRRSLEAENLFLRRQLAMYQEWLWSAIIRVVFVSALPLSSDHALALAMEYS